MIEQYFVYTKGLDKDEREIIHKEGPFPTLYIVLRTRREKLGVHAPENVWIDVENSK